MLTAINFLCQSEVTVYPKKYAHGFCFAVLYRDYTLTDFPISIRLTSLALWQSNDCPSASKATPMNMDKYFMWIHYERLHNHNKAKHNKTVCIFIGIYCTNIQKSHSSLSCQYPTCNYSSTLPSSRHYHAMTQSHIWWSWFYFIVKYLQRISWWADLFGFPVLKKKKKTVVHT